MAITLVAGAILAARNAACDAVVDLIDAGAGAGTMELQTSGGTEAATVTFSDPAFGAASNGTASANAITDDSSATGNASAVEICVIQDSNSSEVFRGTVAESGADLNLDDGTPGGGVIITAGDTVEINSMTFTITYTAP